ncbi:MAG TPA: Crp/Fnr family transcriptional regulator [Niabella sp.]|nr:Crp/Fnr family transcriptional regulator [Chitinophagaceae bacterium]HRN47438.1 Crp/Fnr family transcriptional regulator [Niabella sp.]HRO83400.1 Crp/Fnr family transcriptional regulator [Niabella sp.]
MTVNGNSCLTCKVKNCSLLKPCTDDTLTVISKFKSERKFDKGEFVFKEGDMVKGIYFIKKGMVKIEKRMPKGRAFILKICGPGGLFGHRGHDQNFYQNYSVVALSECASCFIPFDVFNEILNNAPDLEKQIIKDNLKDLEKMEQRSLSLAFKPVKERVAEGILLLSEIYCYDPQKKGFCIDLSRQDFADLTGTTKEQVSAVFREFSRNSIIRYSGKKISYIDLEALKSFSADR